MPAFDRPESTDAHPNWRLPTEGTALGVDWSGGTQAGRKIWAAWLRFAPVSVELVQLDRPFLERPARGDVIRAFQPWLMRQAVQVAGLDFCLSLPRPQLERLGLLAAAEHGPAALGRAIAQRFSGPDAFRLAAGAEAKRDTDRASRAPFAATNLRMYRQTYAGLAALGGVEAAFPPWNLPAPGQLAAVEVLPAQVARLLVARTPYKGAGTSPTRVAMLARLADACGLRASEADTRAIAADDEGDALDAVLAALAAASARAQGFASNYHAPEGAIFGVA
jgi:hypothetical protein